MMYNDLVNNAIDRIGKRIVNDELTELSLAHPSIQSFNDIRRLPFFDDMRSLAIDQGKTLLCAYEITKKPEEVQS